MQCGSEALCVRALFAERFFCVQGRAVLGWLTQTPVLWGLRFPDNPQAPFVRQVKVTNPPAGSNLPPVYAGQVDCKCDKPEKVLVLEIGSDGSGKFDGWQ
ncbi:MAG: hypothetical protein ABSA59_19300 [Terriglobia bacterium]